MTDTPDIKDLIAELRDDAGRIERARSSPRAFQWLVDGLIRAADALESRERLLTEVEADLNAARARAEAAEARVAELEAVITEERALHEPRKFWETDRSYTLVCATEVFKAHPCLTYAILSAPPADSLNRVRAEAAAAALRDAADRLRAEHTESEPISASTYGEAVYVTRIEASWAAAERWLRAEASRIESARTEGESQE